MRQVDISSPAFSMAVQCFCVFDEILLFVSFRFRLLKSFIRVLILFDSDLLFVLIPAVMFSIFCLFVFSILLVDFFQHRSIIVNSLEGAYSPPILKPPDRRFFII